MEGNRPPHPGPLSDGLGSGRIADVRLPASGSGSVADHFLQAMASVDDTSPLGELTARLGQRVKRGGHQVRTINPFAPGNATLIETISRDEFVINGVRNKDLRRFLFADADAAKEAQRRYAAAAMRPIALLRARRLVRKVSGSHRYHYHLSAKFRVILTVLISVRNVVTKVLTKLIS
jgi:hypothetical protein